MDNIARLEAEIRETEAKLNDIKEELKTFTDVGISLVDKATDLTAEEKKVYVNSLYENCSKIIDSKWEKKDDCRRSSNFKRFQQR